MSKEQIKRILLKFRDDTSIAEATNMMPPSLDYYAEQILALFPQGDVGRWVFKTDKLTPLQVLTCVCQQCPFPGELETRCSWCDYPKMMEFLRLALSAIDDFYQQRETQTLKEQMERVIGAIDRQIDYIKFSALNFKQNDTGKACTNAILGTLENLKDKLEGNENA